MKTVYLALGSNMGDREAHLRRAIEELQAPDLNVARISGVYETAPQGYSDQGWFLNLVVEAQTSLLPMRLLARCQRIERLLKRRHEIVNGPRTIDIDILFYAKAIVHSPRLQIPHPRFRDRRFVLEPLVELNPEMRDPETGAAIAPMLSAVKEQAVRRTAIVIPAPANG